MPEMPHCVCTCLQSQSPHVRKAAVAPAPPMSSRPNPRASRSHRPSSRRTRGKGTAGESGVRAQPSKSRCGRTNRWKRPTSRRAMTSMAITGNSMISSLPSRSSTSKWRGRCAPRGGAGTACGPNGDESAHASGRSSSSSQAKPSSSPSRPTCAPPGKRARLQRRAGREEGSRAASSSGESGAGSASAWERTRGKRLRASAAPSSRSAAARSASFADPSSGCSHSLLMVRA
mmetsp:Transcript_123773/g.385429  ORF Transcript_123773/g.385429 Transcript_123773/m.385429 type:complete len:231 (+) Transcript_123773:498-1190(+)